MSHTKRDAGTQASTAVGGEDNSCAPPGTPSTIYIGCVGGSGSSLAAAAFLGLCLGPLFTFAHTVLGTLLTSGRAAGAAALLAVRAFAALALAFVRAGAGTTSRTGAGLRVHIQSSSRRSLVPPGKRMRYVARAAGGKAFIAPGGGAQAATWRPPLCTHSACSPCVCTAVPSLH